MDKVYDKGTRKLIAVPKKMQAFTREYEELCRKHNLMISHEDGHGSFIIETFDEKEMCRVKGAHKGF